MNQIKVELQEVYGKDRDIANAAWTSSLDYIKKQTRTDEDVKRIINMLADQGHSTPFESVIFKFWIKLPIVADRQLMTHRLQSANGLSGRYRTVPNEFLLPPNDVISIATKVNSSIISDYENHCKWANEVYEATLSNAKQAEKNKLITNDEYKRLREFYRGVLPQNNMTERVTIMNLRSWCNFYRLRSANNAQPEIQYIAKEMLALIKNNDSIKLTIEALEKNNWKI